MMTYNISKYTFDKWNQEGECWDWTAIGDIGKVFDGKMLTIEEYRNVEDKYIEALYYILDYLDIKTLKIKNVVKSFSDETFGEIHKTHMQLYDEQMMVLYKNVKKLKRLTYEEIGNFCRLQLREDIGAKVFCPFKLGVYICYDFLLGIKSTRPINPIIPAINDLGLIVVQE